MLQQKAPKNRFLGKNVEKFVSLNHIRMWIFKLYQSTSNTTVYTRQFPEFLENFSETDDDDSGDSHIYRFYSNEVSIISVVLHLITINIIVNNLLKRSENYLDSKKIYTLRA